MIRPRAEVRIQDRRHKIRLWEYMVGCGGAPGDLVLSVLSDLLISTSISGFLCSHISHLHPHPPPPLLPILPFLTRKRISVGLAMVMLVLDLEFWMGWYQTGWF